MNTECRGAEYAGICSVSVVGSCSRSNLKSRKLKLDVFNTVFVNKWYLRHDVCQQVVLMKYLLRRLYRRCLPCRLHQFRLCLSWVKYQLTLVCWLCYQYLRFVPVYLFIASSYFVVNTCICYCLSPVVYISCF